MPSGSSGIPFERLKAAARFVAQHPVESDEAACIWHHSRRRDAHDHENGEDRDISRSNSDDDSDNDARKGIAIRLHASDAQSAKLRKSNRKRPLEMSSKCPVFSPAHCQPLRKKIQPRDPRFSNLSGRLNPDLFAKSFHFLDELEQNQKQDIISELEHPTNQPTEERKMRLKLKLEKMRSICCHRKELREKEQLKKELNKQEKQKIIETGKIPFIHSDTRIRSMLKTRKFEELQKRGKLNKHLTKVRRKQTTKDRKFMPAIRPS